MKKFSGDLVILQVVANFSSGIIKKHTRQRV